MLREMFGQYAATGGAYASKVRAPHPHPHPHLKVSWAGAAVLADRAIGGRLAVPPVGQAVDDVAGTVGPGREGALPVPPAPCTRPTVRDRASRVVACACMCQVMVKNAKRSMDSASALAKTVVRWRGLPRCAATLATLWVLPP